MTIVRTYAGNAHSDSDGLTDREEMGEVVYDPGNKLLFDLLQQCMAGINRIGSKMWG